MRVLSGIQPSGKLHLGNYFGALRQFLALQAEHECFYFVANYHALTSQPEPAALRELTRDVVLDFLALGLDPERSTLFLQSDVPEVTELAWLLSAVTPLGLLERCHSYKDKVAQGLAPNHALFSYPVLMAADILIYGSNLVPVGQDQKQHLEVTRDLAVKFNNRFGETLVVPEPYILPAVAVVPGTDGRKMSKSYDNTIELFAPDKTLKKKVMSIVTDSTPVEAPKDPDTCLLFSLFKLVVPEPESAAMAERYRRGGVGYGELKKRILAGILELLGPARERRAALAADQAAVDRVLAAGGERARAAARQTLVAARRAVGL